MTSPKTYTVPESILDAVRKHQADMAKRCRAGREIVGQIIFQGTTAVRYRRLPNRARSINKFTCRWEDLKAAHAELGSSEWAMMVHSHPSGKAAPSKADLRCASQDWIGRPYAIYSVPGDSLYVWQLSFSRLDYEMLSLASGGTGNAALTKFRATLPEEGSELRICPPNCKVDHDANDHVPAPPATRSKSTALPTTDREEGTMATTADIAQGFASKEASAYTRILNSEGKTVARAYDRKRGGVVIYFAEGALEGVSVAKELDVEAAKGGESKIAVNGGARALQAARSVLKKTGAAAA